MVDEFEKLVSMSKKWCEDHLYSYRGIVNHALTGTSCWYVNEHGEERYTNIAFGVRVGKK